MIRILVLISSAVVAQGRVCIPVDGDRLLGRDLASAGAVFAGLSPTEDLGPAPMPGAARVFTVPELQRVARAHNLAAGGFEEICFERTSEVLTEARVSQALAAVLAPEVRLEVLDFSRYRLPKGELEFRLAGLCKPPAARPDIPVLWRGRLRYGDRRSATVWAKVRVSRQITWVETATAIRVNEEIRAEQLSAKSGWRYGAEPDEVRDVPGTAGRRAIRAIRAGEVITREMVADSKMIDTGDPVEITVTSGDATLRFVGRAETAGSRHQYITVTSAVAPKKLKARVEAKGRVTVDADEKAPALAGSGTGNAGSRAVVDR